MRPEPAPGESPRYAAAGVDVAAGEEAVARMAPAVRATQGPEVLGGVGGFAGLFALTPGRFRRPVLVASTDGVGTKALLAHQLGRYDTIGIDLVAMCVDDLVCAGAQPLFLLDYLATARLDPAVAASVVAGIADGCRQAGCALIGGETAEHPGGEGPGAFDLAGFAVGAVEADALLGPERVRPGDALVGLGSPGLRSNGYSLARRVLLEEAGLPLAGPAWAGAGHSLADELLAPSVIYAPAVLGLVRDLPVRALAHVTGGGIMGNVPRALPPTCDAVLARSSWEVPRIFAEVQRLGGIGAGEMPRVFNLGLGMVVVVAPQAAEDAVASAVNQGHTAAIVGSVVEGTGQVRLEG